MQCNDLEQVIEQSGFAQLPEAARAHLAGCPACTALVADFSAIVAAASEIPAEVEPPARVWVSLRAQLEAEGIIHAPEQVLRPAPAEEYVSWWHGFLQLLNGRTVAAAAVLALVVAAGLFQWRRSESTPVSTAVVEPFAEADSTLDREEQSLGPIQNASTLGTVSTADASLRENLVTVNAFIKECRKRLKEDPNDAMAREYLSTAYQQKAEILAAMMERGRSVN